MDKVTVALKVYEDGDDLKSPVIDLLTDLRHYCRANGLDFDEIARVAADHYEAESKSF